MNPEKLAQDRAVANIVVPQSLLQLTFPLKKLSEM